MILDSLLMFDTNRAGTALTVGTVVSTNILDLHGAGLIPVLASGQGARDIGIGDNPAMKILAQVTTTLTGTTSTLSVALQGSPDNGAGAPAGFVTWYASPVAALASLVTGARLLDMDMPRPVLGQPIPRFLQVAWITASANFTGGAVSAGLVLDRQDYVNYPAGINISN